MNLIADSPSAGSAASVTEPPEQAAALRRPTRRELSATPGLPGRLPVPVIESYAWQEQGACAGAESSVFFHPEGERGPSRRRRERRALAICATCPVLRACRDHALAVREPYGVWGGMTEEDRQQGT